MGSYLSEPITEKISAEEANEQLACGSSSMQGWRVSQEDAHNCILDYDKNTSFFAVYDGHGGHEVALYCSQKLPEYLKSLELYKQNNVQKALEEAFLGFDATIASPDVVKVLKEMAKDKDSGEESDEDEENVNHLYEEASMPIEQVIEKYTNNLLGRNASLKDDKPSSPFLKAKSSLSSSGCTSGTSSSHTSGPHQQQVEEVDEVSSSSATVRKDENVENGHNALQLVIDANAELKETQCDGDLNNGEKPTTTTAPIENGSPRKGKATVKTKGVSDPEQEQKEPIARIRPKRTVQQMYAQLLDTSAPNAESDSDESDDDNDKTFEDPTLKSTSDDDDDEGVNPSLEDIDSSEDEDDAEEEDDDDEELSEEEEEDVGFPQDEDESAATEFARTMVEEPGSDSGCTAVVALLKEGTLYVANAGDSRCIVCRNGTAIDMSFDHKPEDEIERNRILKAGGRVTADGRVNGGLNLSRAIGDHAYKQNQALDAREQMITALPDVKTLNIGDHDEFMVLACDGIWNYMSSQEVVNFVRQGIKNGTKLSKICEEMFDHCLAPNTMGDGTGCDNMTAIIVNFTPQNIGVGLKRSASEVEEADTTKRPKTEETDDGDELPSTTTT